MTNHRPACPSQAAPQAAFWHWPTSPLSFLWLPSLTCVDLPAVHLYSFYVSSSWQTQTDMAERVHSSQLGLFKGEFSLTSYLHLTLRWRLAYQISLLPPADSLFYYSNPIWASICGSLVPASFHLGCLMLCTLVHLSKHAVTSKSLMMCGHWFLASSTKTNCKTFALLYLLASFPSMHYSFKLLNTVCAFKDLASTLLRLNTLCHHRSSSAVQGLF